MRGVKISFKEIQKLIQSQNKYNLLTIEEDYNEYLKNKEFNSQNFYLTLKCKKCKNVFKRTIFDLKHSITCPWGCYSKRILKTTFDHFLKRFIKKGLNKIFWIKFNKEWFEENYKNSYTKNLIFKCKKCKSIVKKSYQNINDESGCLECSKKERNRNRKLTYENFLLKSKNNKYINQYILPDKEWFEENYTSQLKTYLNIYCKNCDKYFKKSVNEFLKGSGCSCVGRKRKLTQEEVIKNLKNIFPQYNYSKVSYKNTTTKIEIICPIHGSFFKKYNDMMQNQGCPLCSKENQRSKGEEKISQLLNKFNIKYINECKIRNFKNLRFDFYLPDYNLAIEYDGEYHFKKIPKREDQFRKTKKRDFLKNKLCHIYKINLIRIPYYKFNNLEEYLIKILKREKILSV